MKKTSISAFISHLLLSIILTAAFSAKAQLHVPPFVSFPPGTGCGIINPTVSVVSVSPACYRSSDTIELKSDILVDSIYVKFGDGKDTMLVNPPLLVFNVVHAYVFSPSDSCPTPFLQGQPAIVCPIEAHFFKKCPGSYSYTPSSTAISFRFKPRVRFLPIYTTNYIQGQKILILCNTVCASLDLSNCCTNTYWNTDSTDYTWSFGDGTPDTTISNTPDAVFFDPIHCYAHPSSGPAYYTLKLHAENTCGISEDWAKVYIEELDTFQLPAGPYCTGTAVQLHLTAAGGNGHVTLNTTVSPGGSATIVGDTTASPSITFTAPGNYTITTIYDQCPQTKTINIDEGVNIVQGFVPDGCFTGNNQIILSDYFSSSATTQTNHFALRDSAGILFSNTSGTIPSNIIALPHAGTYYIADTSITICNTLVYRDTFVLNTPIVVTLRPDTTQCVQTNCILPSFGGIVPTLNGVPVTSDTFPVTTVGVFPFVYTPSCGNSVTFTLTAQGTPAYCIDQNFCAYPGLVNLTGDTPGMIFSVNGIVSSAINGDTATNFDNPFTSVYTDGLNCTFRDTGHIYISTSINATENIPDTICQNSSFSVTGTNGALTPTINWGDGTTDNNLSHTYAGTGIFNLSLKFSNGACDTTILDTVMVIPAPNATFSFGADTICNGETATILFTPDVRYAYQWTYQTNVTDTMPVIVAQNIGGTVVCESLTLSVSYPGCAAINDSKPICFFPGAQALMDLNYDSVCSPLPITLINNSISAVGASFEWFRNDTLFSTSNTLEQFDTLYAYASDVTYTFKLRVFSCGRYDSIVKQVIVHSADFSPAIYTDAFQKCVYEDFHFSSSTVPGCSVTYDFGDGGITQAMPSDSPVIHAYQAPGDYTVGLTMYCACQVRSDNLLVHVNPGPVISASAPSVACTDSVVTIHTQNTGIIPASSYQTYFGDGTFDSLSSTPNHAYHTTGTFNGWVIALGINGCYSDTAKFHATVYQTPSADLTGADTFACSSILTLFSVDTVTPNTTYQWNIVYGNHSTFVTTYDGTLPLFANETGLHSIILSAYNNNDSACKAVGDTFHITVYPSPTAFFTVDQPFVNSPEYVFPIQNKSTPTGNTYFWDFGDSKYSNEINPGSHGYTKTGTYIITLTARNGPCEDTTNREVHVDPFLQVFVPNIFTPNNDGNNDFFQMFGNIQDIDFMHVMIFDRVGEKVFDSYDLNFKWDGIYKGKPLQPAVFVYIIEISPIADEDMRRMKGSITLLR